MPDRATFAGAQRGPMKSKWIRVTIRPVDLRGQRYLQLSYFDGKKTDVSNCESATVPERIDELLAIGFAGIHLDLETESLDIRTTKKGQISVGRKRVDAATPLDTTHNRIKDLPLPEGPTTASRR